MKIATQRALVAAAAIIVAASTLTACSNGSSSSAGPSDPAHAKIGFLLPESLTARYERADHPDFVAKVKELCSGCTVLYANADGDAAKQQQQAESMLTQGVDVLVLSSADTSAGAAIVAEAKAKKVQVVSYDRLTNSPDVSYFISFDNYRIGQIQAQALLDELKKRGVQPGDGGILMLNGAPDASALPFKTAAHSVLDKGGYKILAEYDTPGWDPAKAQDWVAGQVTQFGSQIKGIYSANDGMTGGAIAALKAAGVTKLPPITGQDAEVAALQRILTGEQFMTIYRRVKEEAGRAAELAVDLTKGKHPKADTVLKTADGHPTPSIVLTPVTVTAANIQSAVIDDGFVSASEICTADYAAACAAAGIK